MRVFVLLALAVAVAHAGFTGSLNQQVQPHLQQAFQQIRAELALKAPARNSAEVAFQAKFFETLQQQITTHMDNIQAAMNQAEVLVNAIAQAAHTAATQLQQLGTTTHDQAQDIMSGFLSVISGLFSSNSRALPAHLQPILAAVLASPTFINAVHNSATYICLASQGVPVTFEMVQQINSQPKPQGWDEFVQSDEAQTCINQLGGLTAMIQNSGIVGTIQGLLKPMGLMGQIEQLVHNAISEPWASQIMQGLNGNGRGIFSNIGNLASGAWDSMTDAVGNAASSAWNTVSNGASGFAQYMSQLASAALSAAADKFEKIKQIAAAVIESGIEGMAQLAADKAFELMAAMAPHAVALGNTWTQALNLYESVHGLFNPGK